MRRLYVMFVLMILGSMLFVRQISYAMSDINHLHAFAGSGRILNTDFAYVGPHLECSGQLLFQYLNQPLKPISLNFTERGFSLFSEQVDHRLDMQVSLSIALFRRLQIAVLLPFTFVQKGLFYGPVEGSPYFRYESVQSAVNDIHLFAKVIFWENSTKKPTQDLTFGIGGTFDISVSPGARSIEQVVFYAQGAADHIGTKAQSSVLYPQIILRSKIVGHLQYRWLTIGANLGIRIHPLAHGPESAYLWDPLIREAPSQDWSNTSNMFAISYALGVLANVFKFRQKADFFVFADFWGLSHLIDGQSSFLQRAVANPLELALGGKIILWKQLTFLVGMSVGLTQGYGAATVRPLLSASWTHAF